MEKTIKLNESNILRLEIETRDGNSTGEYLEFDLEDLELPFKYQELIDEDKKNKKWIRDEMLIIDKRQDVKGDRLFSKNEEDKLKALNEFFKKEAEIYNLFLGENGVQKLLNGRKLGWTSLREIDEIIEKQIAPHLDLTMDNITKKVKEKYSEALNRNEEVIE